MKPKKSSESSLSLENSDSLKNFIENQFQCSICKDIFVSPTIINCGHTFCDKCTVRTVNDFLGRTCICIPGRSIPWIGISSFEGNVSTIQNRDGYPHLFPEYSE